MTRGLLRRLWRECCRGSDGQSVYATRIELRSRILLGDSVLLSFRSSQEPFLAEDTCSSRGCHGISGKMKRTAALTDRIIRYASAAAPRLNMKTANMRRTGRVVSSNATPYARGREEYHRPAYLSSRRFDLPSKSKSGGSNVSIFPRSASPLPPSPRICFFDS